MKSRPDQLHNHLQQNLAPVYLVGGDEPLQVQESCDAIRHAARQQGFTEREVMNAERGFSWDEILQSGASLSLFGDKKIIEVNIPNGKPGDQGGKVLREYAQNPPEDTLLLVICGKLDGSSVRTKWAQSLEKAGVFIQVWPVDSSRLHGWIQERMRRQGLQASRDAISLLADKVEGNLLAARQEIDKLLMLHGPGRIDADAVADAVSDCARYSIYGLVDTVLTGHADKTVMILNGLRDEGVDPILVLWALSREIRGLSAMAAEVRKGARIESVLTRQRVWERRKPLVREALKRHGLGRWYGFLQQNARIDRIIKGLEPGKPWDELLQLGLAMAGKKVL
ncbi:MAG TPA: DNA polymerase III subunit delta [Gammaproteobacteria bacterium]|nr:DNA polymerase III subunit delta [Gammaproteobacteria bacterium]